jgi:hypothetical protein
MDGQLDVCRLVAEPLVNASCDKDFGLSVARAVRLLTRTWGRIENSDDADRRARMSRSANVDHDQPRVTSPRLDNRLT